MTRAHDATDTAITQATVHLVAHHQDPTVGAVAQATGVARGTVYRYLPTRQALLSTVLDQGLGKAERHLSQANLTAVPVAESLTRAVRALVAQGRLSWCSLISGCSLEGAPRASPLWSRCWDRGRQGRSWVAICPSHVRLRRCIRWSRPAYAREPTAIGQGTPARPCCSSSWKAPNHRQLVLHRDTWQRAGI